MPKYSLTPRQKDTVRAMVAAVAEIGDEHYHFQYGYDGGAIGTLVVGVYQMDRREVPCGVSDLARFATFDFVQGDDPSDDGAITQTAVDAVSSDFEIPPHLAHGGGFIGQQFNAPATGTFNAAAGPLALAEQHVNAGGDNAALIARLAQVTAELIATVGEVLPADAAASVAEAAQAATDAAAGDKPKTRAVANDVGATVTAALKGLATFGDAAAGAEKVAGLVGKLHEFVATHSALMIAAGRNLVHAVRGQ